MVETQLKAIRNHYGVTNILGALLLITCPLTIDDSISQYNDILAIVVRHALVSGLLTYAITRLVQWYKTQIVSKKYFVTNIAIAGTLIFFVIVTMIVRLCLKDNINKTTEYFVNYLSACICLYGVNFYIGSVVTKSAHSVITENFTETNLQVQAYQKIEFNQLHTKYSYCNLLIVLGASVIGFTFLSCIYLDYYLGNTIPLAIVIISFATAIAGLIIGSILEVKHVSKKYSIALIVIKVIYFTLFVVDTFLMHGKQDIKGIMVAIILVTGLSGFSLVVLYLIQLSKTQTLVKKDIKCILLPLYKQSMELEKQADTNTTSTM